MQRTYRNLGSFTNYKKWNPDWTPRFFMNDYSEAELNTLEAVFLGVMLFLCDFHWEQALVRDNK